MITKLVSILFILFIYNFSCLSQQFGELDLTFNPFNFEMYYEQTGFNDRVFDIEETGVNEYVVVGSFTELNGEPCNRIAKVNGTSGFIEQYPQFNINSSIKYVEKQSDGKLIVAGAFTQFDGINTRIIRLNIDGTLDNTFNLNISFVGLINDLKVGSNDEIYVAGYQMYFDNTPHNGIMRLTPDGNVDPTFITNGGTNENVLGIRIGNDDAIFIFGNFTYYGVIPVNGYLKLLPNGQIDNSFNYSLSNVKLVEPSQNGEVFIRQDTGTIRRLFENGTIDNDFVSPSVSNAVYFLFPDNQKGVRVYGNNINNVNGVPSNNFFLLDSIGLVNSSFNLSVNSASNIIETIDGHFAVCGLFSAANDQFYIENFAVLDTLGIILPNPLPFGFKMNAYGGAISIHGADRIAVGFSGVDISTGAGNFALYHINGNIDSSFMENLGSGPSGAVYAIKSLVDGKLLIGGMFYSVNGHLSKSIARINSDGTVDGSFNPAVLDGEVESIDVQPDGKILVAGAFTSVNGSTQYYVARLNQDGSKDPSFNSPLFDNATFGSQANIIKFAANNKIYVGGKFACCNSIIRLNNNGSIDNTFNAGSFGIHSVNDIEELNSGKVLFCGRIAPVGSTQGTIFARANSNGSFDNTFNLYLSESGYNESLNDIEILSNGEILVSGDLSNNSMYSVKDTNGDEIYSSSSVIPINAIIFDAVVQPDGKFLLVGTWNYLNSIARNHLARIHNYTLLKDTLCSNQEFNFGEIITDQPVSGFYYDTLQSTTIESDSIIMMQLFVHNNLNTTVVTNGLQLELDCPGCEIQWFDCVTNSIVQGAQSNVFEPTLSGSYAAFLESENCLDTTDCVLIEIEISSLIEYDKYEYLLYPNPNSGTFNIALNKSFSSTNYIVYDLIGNVLYKGSLDGSSINKVELNGIPGVYLFELFSNESSLGNEFFIIR